MVDAVGGSEYASVLLGPLEQLAGTEESTVRNQSVASMKKIAGQLSDTHLVEWMLPLLYRMTKAEWFTSRISAAGLYASIYPRVGDSHKRELRQWFLSLCNTDETPMVKRAAASHFGEFCSVMDSQTVGSECLPVLQKLAKDEQDSVKLLTVSACIAIAKMFSKDNKALNVTKMTSLIKGLVDDKSWRVRYMAADKFCDLSAALGPSIAQSDAVLDDYVKLLSDSEAEVRTAAASRVGDIAKLAGEAQTLKKFLKPLGPGKGSVLQLIVADTEDATAFTRGQTREGEGEGDTHNNNNTRERKGGCVCVLYIHPPCAYISFPLSRLLCVCVHVMSSLSRFRIDEYLYGSQSHRYETISSTFNT